MSQNPSLEILTEIEKKEFPKLKHFKRRGVLAGGTALAMQIRHRRSYDFDIFFPGPLPKSIAPMARRSFGRIMVRRHLENDLTFTTPPGLRITFFHYPFKPLYPLIRASAIPLFSWKDIALDKAYTIGRRALYRDYVDLFFLMKEKKLSIEWLIKNARKKFAGLFPVKPFLEQLTYLADVPPAPIEFLGPSYTREEILKFFQQKVKEYLKKNL